MPFLHFEKSLVLFLHRFLVLFLILGEIVRGFFSSFLMLFANFLTRMGFGITVFVRGFVPAFAGAERQNSQQQN